MKTLFADRKFRWILGGGAISMLGDQFTLIALPWLVLKLTGDPLALGLVLAVMSLPRAVFILFGGALVDRHSSRNVLMLTKLANLVLLATFAALTWTGAVQLWMIYGLALLIGLVTDFSFPAGSAILPQTMPSVLLQPANGVLMGMRQVSVLIGPVLAGGLIALFGDGVGTGGRGLALAFALDAELCATQRGAKPNGDAVLRPGDQGGRVIVLARQGAAHLGPLLRRDRLLRRWTDRGRIASAGQHPVARRRGIAGPAVGGPWRGAHANSADPRCAPRDIGAIAHRSAIPVSLLAPHARACCGNLENSMLETLAIVRVVLWLLGLVTYYTMGGLIHILLVIAIVVILVRVISGRKA